jgi:hypothetical protein
MAETRENSILWSNPLGYSPPTSLTLRRVETLEHDPEKRKPVFVKKIMLKQKDNAGAQFNSIESCA